MKAHALAVAVAITVGLVACAGDGSPEGPNGEPTEALTVVTSSGEHDFWVEIADDDSERARGLMYRDKLADDRGMLFEFPAMGPRAFWMQNTPESLDIIYIDDKGRIVSIAENAEPFSPELLPSNGHAKGVLELRAGRSDEIGAKPGDLIKHPFFGTE